MVLLHVCCDGDGDGESGGDGDSDSGGSGDSSIF